MAYVKISDPYKRNKIVNDYLATRKALFNEPLAEQLGDITKLEHLATMFKPIASAISKANNAAIETAVQMSNLPALMAPPAVQTIEGQLPVGLATADEPPIFTQAMPEHSVPTEKKIIGPLTVEYLTRFGNKYAHVDKVYGLRSVGDNGILVINKLISVQMIASVLMVKHIRGQKVYGS